MTETLKKNHLKNLVAIAMADGRLDKLEKEFLIEKAYNLGFSKKEIDEILYDSTIDSVIVEGSPEEREEILADAILMTVIDGNVDDKEMLFIKELAANFKFSQKYINKLVDRGYQLWHDKKRA
jgi:uncharacterized tellurite resistance protein B-like protein